MSGYIVERFWRLNQYRYVFYRFIVEYLCSRFLDGPCRVLDAGCGGNGCSLTRVPLNVDVTGIDIKRSNVVKSRCRCRGFNFVVGSITHLPFKNELFDLVVCVDVLEHVRRKDQAVTELSRAMRRNGRLVGSTSNMMNPILLFDCLTPKPITQALSKKYAEDHYARHARFTPSGLTHSLRRAKLEFHSMFIVGYPPFNPWLYNYNANLKPPWFAALWILFDKITRNKPLLFLKETMVYEAVKP
jgi:2-polyprenyl-3-methyl-5-hydroxy-6-metoxy-1,4-benzoquinol methylase